MTIQTVRQAFYDAWAVPNLPLIKTINQAADFATPDPPIWATFAFAADQSSHTTMGSSPWIEEIGVASVFLGGESGDSDATIAQAAEEVKKFWQMWISPDGNTWVTTINGPRPPDPDAQGITYSLIVDLVYTHQYKGA